MSPHALLEDFWRRWRTAGLGELGKGPRHSPDSPYWMAASFFCPEIYFSALLGHSCGFLLYLHLFPLLVLASRRHSTAVDLQVFPATEGLSVELFTYSTPVHCLLDISTRTTLKPIILDPFYMGTLYFS